MLFDKKHTFLCVLMMLWRQTQGVDLPPDDNKTDK